MKQRAGCTRFGLESRGIIVPENFPAVSSSGLALARALIPQPKLLLADEPTGDLDGRTAESVFELIARLHRDYQLTSLTLPTISALHGVVIGFCGCITDTWKKWRRSRCRHERIPNVHGGTWKQDSFFRQGAIFWTGNRNQAPWHWSAIRNFRRRKSIQGFGFVAC